MTPGPIPQPIPLKCGNPVCRSVLGTAAEDGLIVAGAVIKTRVTLVCQVCGRKEFYRPGKKRLARYAARE